MILHCYGYHGHHVYDAAGRRSIVCDACGAVVSDPTNPNNTGGLPDHDYEVRYAAAYGMGSWYGFATRDAAEAWLGNRNGVVTPIALVDPAKVKVPS